MRILLLLVLILKGNCSTKQIQSSHIDADHQPAMSGLTMVAPPSPFKSNPMIGVQEVAANWIAVIPYGFTGKGETTLRFNMSQRQWWGERKEGVVETIVLAKEARLKVMLKPQVWGHNWWTGDYDFDSEEEWSKWEKAYETYILFYAEIAESLEVDLFCIGTEFKTSVAKRLSFWSQLIPKVRSVCTSKLTYAANWDNYAYIPFWQDLDLVGINAYFPLIDTPTPKVQILQNQWTPILNDLDVFYEKTKKPIAFTEYGYLSVDGCAFNTWELENRVRSTDINELAQANALEGLYRACSSRSYWQGGFLWKWFPGMQGHEGYPERDYTPQGKLAERTVREWHQKWQRP